MTLIQGEGPPNSILPGINRFAGIVIGMVTLFVVTVILEFAADAGADPVIPKAQQSRQ